MRTRILFRYYGLRSEVHVVFGDDRYDQLVTSYDCTAFLAFVPPNRWPTIKGRWTNGLPPSSRFNASLHFSTWECNHATGNVVFSFRTFRKDLQNPNGAFRSGDTRTFALPLCVRSDCRYRRRVSLSVFNPVARRRRNILIVPKRGCVETPVTVSRGLQAVARSVRYVRCDRRVRTGISAPAFENP